MQKHYFTEINGNKFVNFDYEEFGVKGVGKDHRVIIPMDKYIDHSQDKELHLECLKGLALTKLSEYKIAEASGALPPEEVANFQGYDSWTAMLANLEKYDPDGIHLQNIKDLIDVDDPQNRNFVIKYMYFALGAVIPWFFVCYLKYNDFFTKTKTTGDWTPAAKNFPKLVKYLETLPFKQIGRVLFFTTYPNTRVMIHRDAPVMDHKDHNINLFFDGGWRPSFIWDEVKKEKIYLPEGSKSYFFNNRDYHGVDSEPAFRYTLRIDGVFTDELCEELGMEDGYTWRKEYDK